MSVAYTTVVVGLFSTEVTVWRMKKNRRFFHNVWMCCCDVWKWNFEAALLIVVSLGSFAWMVCFLVSSINCVILNTNPGSKRNLIFKRELWVCCRTRWLQYQLTDGVWILSHLSLSAFNAIHSQFILCCCVSCPLIVVVANTVWSEINVTLALLLVIIAIKLESCLWSTDLLIHWFTESSASSFLLMHLICVFAVFVIG